jgi:phosphoglycolate phosphatase
MVAGVLRKAGLSAVAAADVTAAAWFIPDPVALALPLADLPTLLGALRAQDCKIAVATIDDRAPTAATLAALGVAPLVDALACADDGLPLKPAPDTVLTLCRQLGVPPSQTVVVGDTAADLRMGRAAGAGLVIGVRSGVGTDEILMPLADLVIDSVAELYSPGK